MEFCHVDSMQLLEFGAVALYLNIISTESLLEPSRSPVTDQEQTVSFVFVCFFSGSDMSCSLFPVFVINLPSLFHIFGLS